MQMPSSEPHPTLWSDLSIGGGHTGVAAARGARAAVFQLLPPMFQLLPPMSARVVCHAGRVPEPLMTSEDRTAKQRVGRNEATLRSINESVETDYAETDYAGAIGFLCECGHSDCEQTIEMTRAEYESVRANPRRFAVIGDHAISTTEDIVDRHQRYAVVEKHEDVADLAERSDPRR
jgi:hypothetical protein